MHVQLTFKMRPHILNDAMVKALVKSVHYHHISVVKQHDIWHYPVGKSVNFDDSLLQVADQCYVIFTDEVTNYVLKRMLTC